MPTTPSKAPDHKNSAPVAPAQKSVAPRTMSSEEFFRKLIQSPVELDFETHASIMGPRKLLEMMKTLANRSLRQQALWQSLSLNTDCVLGSIFYQPGRYPLETSNYLRDIVVALRELLNSGEERAIDFATRTKILSNNALLSSLRYAFPATGEFPITLYDILIAADFKMVGPNQYVANQIATDAGIVPTEEKAIRWRPTLHQGPAQNTATERTGEELKNRPGLQKAARR